MKSYMKFNTLGISALLLALSLAFAACTTEVEVVKEVVKEVEVIKEVPGETVTVTKEVLKEGPTITREVEVIKEVPGETKTVTVTKEIQVSVPVAADLPAASNPKGKLTVAVPLVPPLVQLQSLDARGTVGGFGIDWNIFEGIVRSQWAPPPTVPSQSTYVPEIASSWEIGQ